MENKASLKLKHKFSFLLLLALSVIFISGCEKYDDGGTLGKAEKRISANDWKLDKYLRNGSDETSELLISNFVESYPESGALTRSYTDNSGDPFSETGAWEFTSDKLQIKVSGIRSVELTNFTGTVSSSSYNILKLTKDEFWYNFENGGDSHEFQFVAK